MLTGANRVRLPAWMPVPAWALLAFFWTVSTAARFALAVTLTQNPIIMPDESLYINLSRSLLDGWAALRGQPVTYDSLLYPLLLAPLRALGGWVDFYRAAQLLNAALISLSAIPVYRMAKDIAGDDRKALAAAALTLLMGDFAISEILMAESLCYPLALTALCLGYRALGKGGSLGGALGAGLVSGLCYMAKPGYMALGVVLCALFIYRAARREEGAPVRALAAAAAFAMVMVLSRLIGLWLGIDYSWASVYQNQTPALTWGAVAQVLQGSLLYLYFLPLAAAVFPAVVPLSGIGRLDRREKDLTAAVAAVAAVMILGTCYTVSISEYSGAPFAARVHLRYFSFLLPVLIALSLSPRLEGFRLNRPAAAMLALLLAASFAFTPWALLSGRTHTVDALALAAVTGDWELTDPKALTQLISIGWLLIGGYMLAVSGWTKKARRGALGALALFMLINNIAGYELIRHNEDPASAADARQAAGWLDGQDVLFVAGDGEFFWNPATALEARTRDQLPAVELNDLIKNTGAGGVYQSFMPEAYWVTRAVRPTGTPRYLVLDSDLLYAVVLRTGVNSFVTDNQKYAFVELPEGGAWAHSALSGLSSGQVKEGSALTVFDPALTAGNQLNAQFLAGSDASGGVLTATVNGESAQFALGAEETWVQHTFTIPGDGGRVAVELAAEGVVNVSSYMVG